MKLMEPTTEYCRQIRAYRKEFLDCGDSMDGTHGLREIEDPVKWIEHCALYKDPLTVPDSRVPATQYIFVREEDDKIVGMLQIRHYFNDYLENIVVISGILLLRASAARVMHLKCSKQPCLNVKSLALIRC